MSEELPQVKENKQEHTSRDAETQLALGIFIIIISMPTLIGTLFADTKAAAIVNVIAGVALLSMGVILVVLGSKTKKRLKAKAE